MAIRPARRVSPVDESRTVKARHLPCCCGSVVFRSVVWGISVVLVALTALPLLRSSRWWIRVWDYPRLQLGAALAVAVLLQVVVFEKSTPSIVMMLVTVAAFAWQAYSVFPYTRLHPVQSLASKSQDGPNRVSVLVANVLQDNRNAAGLFDIVREVDPDILITVETNAWWDAQLLQLQERYPFDVRHPLENTYGIHVFSKLELREVCVRELVSSGIPSVRANVRLRSGREFDLYAVHPEPPLPNKDVEERDAELLIVARESKQRHRPTLIAGDLNDVAWSHTTRLFQRISGLLDPRVGRGLFPTFHADHRLARWPLDHLFHDASFRLVSLKVLRSFGSDHFPICAVFMHDPSAVRKQAAPAADASDQAEASTKIAEGSASGTATGSDASRASHRRPD
jgi:endonuclease/exonuclease/phosphatase (EEP) superfamily protein YafD